MQANRRFIGPALVIVTWVLSHLLLVRVLNLLIVRMGWSYDFDWSLPTGYHLLALAIALFAAGWIVTGLGGDRYSAGTAGAGICIVSSIVTFMTVSQDNFLAFATVMLAPAIGAVVGLLIGRDSAKNRPDAVAIVAVGVWVTTLFGYSEVSWPDWSFLGISSDLGAWVNGALGLLLPGLSAAAVAFLALKSGAPRYVLPALMIAGLPFAFFVLIVLLPFEFDVPAVATAIGWAGVEFLIPALAVWVVGRSIPAIRTVTATA